MAAVQTVLFINKDWQTKEDIKDATNPFGVDTDYLIDGYTSNTYAFADPPFVPGTSWDTEYIWFAPCSKDNPYEILDLDHVEHAEGSEVPHVAILSAQTEYKGSTTVFCKDLDIHDKLVVVSSASKFTFGSVENELTESILITGNGTVFKVSDTIQGCDGFFNNLGTLTVQDEAVFSTVSITNGAGEPIVISGSSTMFEVTDLFNNIGEVTVNGATVTAGAFTNQGGDHHVTINGGSFTVTNAFSNDASLSVENGAKFKAGSFTNGHFVTISGSNTSFETGSLVMNSGSITVKEGANVINKGLATINGTLNISGEGTNFNSNGLTLTNGTINVSNGAAVNVTNTESPVLTTINGTLNISGEGTNFNSNGLTLTIGTINVSNGAAVDAGNVDIGSFKIMTITDSTFKADSINIQNGSMIKMDADSAIETEAISFPSWAGPNVKFIEVDATGFNGSTKIIDMTGESASGSIAGHIQPKEGTRTFNIFEAKDGDISITTESKDFLYVNSSWTGKSDGDIVNNHIYGFNAFDVVADAVKEATEDPVSMIVVEGGEFGTTNAPTFNGFGTTILNGTFATSVCGGKVFNAEGEVSGDINFSIAGGTFSKLVFAGDRVNAGCYQQTRTGNLTTTITSGVFNSAVAGGMLVTVATTNAVLKGDVLLTIKGGNFSDWIYGGGLASKKSFGGTTTIEGNVTVKLDSSESGSNGLKLSTTLVVGSYGAGHIGTEQDKKNTKLILTGGKDIELSGEIWGGCSSDIITTDTIPDKGNNRKLDSTVTGNRILSFTGFNGHLTTQKNRIRAFSDIELKGNSTVTLNNYGSGSVNLSDVVNWTFEYGSSLTGDFINDFNGDTLNLTGFSGTGTFNLMSDSDASNTNDIFNGFGQLNGVELNGAAGSYRNGAWEWDNASLAINNGIMQLTIA